MILLAGEFVEYDRSFASRAESAFKEEIRLLTWAKQGMKLFWPRNRMRDFVRIFIVILSKKFSMEMIAEGPIIASIVPCDGKAFGGYLKHVEDQLLTSSSSDS